MPHSPRSTSLPWLLAAALPCALLTGCALQTTAPPTPLSIPTLSGTVHGGNQVISGSVIQMYAAGSTGYASAATPLLPVATPITTDSTGSFNISTDYMCPSASTQVYLTATGGNPGLAAGTDNTALALMAALGPCGNLNGSTHIIVNEVTTVAAVWPLAQFMSGYANVGASSTNAIGLANAFTNATSIAGVACGCALPSSTSTIMPQYTLNTLADVLAACVNSDGSTITGQPCATLFAAATPSGGTAPTDTVAAALDIALNPANNVTPIYNIAAATAPFQPSLAAAPNDWTVAVSFPDGNYGTLEGAAVDQNGVALFTFYYESGPSSPYLVYGNYESLGFNSNDFATNLNYSIFNPVYDKSSGFWFTTVPTSSYTLKEIDPATGTQLNSFPAGNNYVFDFDSNGNPWGFSSALGLTAYSPSGSSVASGTDDLGFDAADAAGNMWGFTYLDNGIVNPGTFISNTLVKETISGSSITSTSYTGGNVISPEGLALDHNGNIWVFNSTETISEFNSTGAPVTTSAAYSGGGLTSTSHPGVLGHTIAVDGSDNVWAVGFLDNCIAEFSNDGTPLSPATGYGTYVSANQAATSGVQPLYDVSWIWLDPSGNIWVNNNEYPYYATEFLGLATPVVTPRALAAATNTIGTRP